MEMGKATSQSCPHISVFVSRWEKLGTRESHTHFNQTWLGMLLTASAYPGNEKLCNRKCQLFCVVVECLQTNNA